MCVISWLVKAQSAVHPKHLKPLPQPRVPTEVIPPVKVLETNKASLPASSQVTQGKGPSGNYTKLIPLIGSKDVLDPRLSKSRSRSDRDSLHRRPRSPSSSRSSSRSRSHKRRKKHRHHKRS